MTQADPARPPGRPRIRMVWDDLLFLHWPVEVDALRAQVPTDVEIDTHDGRAWIGLVPFTMPLIAPSFCPVPIRGLTRFAECNVRTYVRVNGEPGVWFLSLDAASPPAVEIARSFWHLNYLRARIGVERDGERWRYALVRTDPRGRGGLPERPALRCSWERGALLPTSTPGSLEHFLTERYALFTKKRGTIRRGRIWHVRWPLHEARVDELTETLLAANGVTRPDEEPLALAAGRIEVEGWRLERG